MLITFLCSCLTMLVGVVSGTFHPDGLLYAAAIATGPVRIWDLKAGKIATSLSQESQANAVAISENGYHVATASEDGLVKLWDLRKQSVLQSLTLPARATAVHFDLSGSYLAAAGGSEIRLVQSKTFDAIVTLSGHTGAVSDVKWGKDALSLVSVGVDRSLRVFKA
jgi:pre-mRNA-processing factor 19